jgi:hypothetical protein
MAHNAQDICSGFHPTRMCIFQAMMMLLVAESAALYNYQQSSEPQVQQPPTGQAPAAIGPFSRGSPLIRRDIPILNDKLPSSIPGKQDHRLEMLTPKTNAQAVAARSGATNDETYVDDGGDYMDDTSDGEMTIDGEVGSHVISATGSLRITPQDVWGMPRESNLLRLGEGVGALAYDKSPTGSRSLNHELRRRLQIQDCFTFGMLLCVFALTLYVSCRSIYKVADDPSPILFYSDSLSNPAAPYLSSLDSQRLTCPTADVDQFLQSFNTQPQVCRLRILGKRSDQESVRALFFQGQWNEAITQLRDSIHQLLECLGLLRRFRRPGVIFDVSLDLTPFITGDGRLRAEDDEVELQKFLRNEDNPLEVFCLKKHVEWENWEDIGTNIRQRLRAMGFQGEVEIALESQEEVLIYRNHPWQNFARSHVTRGLVIISMVGAFFWFPYIWYRTRKRKVHAYFTINLEVQRYWELFSGDLDPIWGYRATQ